MRWVVILVLVAAGCGTDDPSVTAAQRGLDTAVLNPFEGQTLREAADEVTYRSVLLYDLRVLQDHLDCEAPA